MFNFKTSYKKFNLFKKIYQKVNSNTDILSITQQIKIIDN